MNEIRYGQASSTFSYVTAAGLIAYAICGANTFGESQSSLLQDRYFIGGNRPTFNSYGGAVTGMFDSNPGDFEKSISGFYARLLADQEPLGIEFEKILYENLWDLYES